MSDHVEHKAKPLMLTDRVREVARVTHYARRTEDAYVDWIKRFLKFHRMRHPAEMGATEIKAFLTDLIGRD